MRYIIQDNSIFITKMKTCINLMNSYIKTYSNFDVIVVLKACKLTKIGNG
jgi:hypothetical protein